MSGYKCHKEFFFIYGIFNGINVILQCYLGYLAKRENILQKKIKANFKRKESILKEKLYQRRLILEGLTSLNVSIKMFYDFYLLYLLKYIH